MLRSGAAQLSLPVDRRESSVRELIRRKVALAIRAFRWNRRYRAGPRRERDMRLGLLCEIDDSAAAVLEARFPETIVHGDIQELDALPDGTELLAGGFPCQDLSQAGRTEGIAGARSGLIGEVFRSARSSSEFPGCSWRTCRSCCSCRKAARSR